MDEQVPGEVIGPSAILLKEEKRPEPAAKKPGGEDIHPIWKFLISREARIVLVVAGLASAFLPWYVSSVDPTNSYTLLSAMTQSNNQGLEIGGILFIIGLVMLAFSSVWWNAAGEVTIFLGLIAASAGIAGMKIPGGGTWNNADGVTIAWLVLVVSFLLLLVRLRMED
jgi:hypothetical protein